MSALNEQVGGDHYRKMGMQPFEFTLRNGWDAAAHSILKYVSRHSAKGGRQDLEKAMHICDIRAELMPTNGDRQGWSCRYLGRIFLPSSHLLSVTAPDPIPMSAYCKANDIRQGSIEYMACMDLNVWVLDGHMPREKHAMFAAALKQTISEIIQKHNY